MWIFLGIVAFLAALITAILMLPVYIIIKTDETGELIIRYKILHKTFGENPDPNNPILKVLKKTAGISRLEKKQLQSNLQKSGFASTVSQTGRILVDLIKKIGSLLKRGTAKRFFIKIVCAEEDAADTAISYGRCCAVVYPIAGALSSIMRVRKKGQRIDISCDYFGGENVFELDFLISVRFFRVLGAFFHVAFKEAKRTIDEQTALQSAKQKK